MKEKKVKSPQQSIVLNLFSKDNLLICGILSTILYVAATILGAIRWDEYDSASQTVSELFAIGAPSSSVIVPAFLIYSLLVFAFGAGIWISAGNQKTLRIVAILVISKEVLGVIGLLFAPMHMRGMGTSLTDLMHIVITMTGVLLCMFPAIIFGAFSFGKGFRIFSFITIVIFLVFGTLAGMEGSKIAENQPTPYAGIWERINIFTYFIWVVVLSIILLKRNRTQAGQIDPQ